MAKMLKKKGMFDFSALSVLVCNLGRCNKNKRHCTQFVCASLQSANKKDFGTIQQVQKKNQNNLREKNSFEAPIAPQTRKIKNSKNLRLFILGLRISHNWIWGFFETNFNLSKFSSDFATDFFSLSRSALQTLRISQIFFCTIFIT